MAGDRETGKSTILNRIGKGFKILNPTKIPDLSRYSSSLSLLGEKEVSGVFKKMNSPASPRSCWHGRWHVCDII
jgi:hypothetical protein